MRPVRPILPAVVLAALLLPCLAAGGDEVGIFFDEYGEENCIRADPYSTLSAYLLLFDPTASGGIGGWACVLDMDNVTLLQVQFAGGGAINVGTEPEYYVGLGSPLPLSAVVELASLSVLVMGSEPVGFFIDAVVGYDDPVYVDGADPELTFAMIPRTIGADNLVAGINRPGCIPEGATWGRVKTLYD